MCQSQKEENRHVRNVRKVASRCVFLVIRASGGSKSRLAKAAGAEPCGQRRNAKNSTPLLRESHFEVKMYKSPQGRSAF